MVFKSLCCLLLLCLTSTQIFAVESKMDQRTERVLEEYNKNFKTVEDVLRAIAMLDLKKAEQLKNYFLAHDLTLKSKLPSLMFQNEHLLFADSKYKNLKMKFNKHHLEISNQDHLEKISFSDDPKQTIKAIELVIKGPNQVSLLSLIIPEAKAEGVTEAIGMAASGLFAAGSFAVLGAMDYVDRFVKDVASIPSDMMERSTRNEAVQACQDLQNNKTVKNVDKIKAKLEKLKIKVDCVPHWESFMENSCGWFDEKIQCLSQGSTEVSDKGRNKVKDVPLENSKGTASSANSSR